MDFPHCSQIAAVLKVATQTMFRKHYFSFGEKMYKQSKGGPIGLRGTCAIARFIMQIFDYKWDAELIKVGLTVHLIARYMDDGRSFLPPLKAGWRWKEGRLLYCVKWEQEDKVLSPTERTKRAHHLSRNKGMEE